MSHLYKKIKKHYTSLLHSLSSFSFCVLQNMMWQLAETAIIMLSEETFQQDINSENVHETESDVSSTTHWLWLRLLRIVDMCLSLFVCLLPFWILTFIKIFIFCLCVLKELLCTSPRVWHKVHINVAAGSTILLNGMKP